MDITKPIQQLSSSVQYLKLSQQQLIQRLTHQDKTIHKLTNQLSNLSHQIQALRAIIDKTQHSGSQVPICATRNQDTILDMKLMQAQMIRASQLEAMLLATSSQISTMLQEDTLADSLESSQSCQSKANNSEGSQETKINKAKTSTSLENMQIEGFSSQVLAQEWKKTLCSLQASLFSSRQARLTLKKSYQGVLQQLQNGKKKIATLQKLKGQLQQSQLHKQKLKTLLEKSQHQRRQLVGKISVFSTAAAQIQSKTKEELIQYTQELSYRVKQLENEKKQLMKASNQLKDDQLKKYELLLKRLKDIKHKNQLREAA